MTRDELYQVARRARDEHNYEEAAKYYGIIYGEDNNSWEAAFYLYCCRAQAQARQTSRIEASARLIKAHLAPALWLISSRVQGKDAQIAAYKEAAIYVIAVVDNYYNISKYSFEQKGRTNANHGVMRDQLFALSELLIYLGNAMANVSPILNDSQLDDLAVSAWKRAINCVYYVWVSFLTVDGVIYIDTSQPYEAVLQLINPLVPKILAREPDYKNPFDTGIKPGDIASSPSASSGSCYVATAVYGSYDCPQVWTLRRFRDYTLAETWYGRAFIRTYYAISPTLVKCFGHTDWFKKMWKGKLDRMVANLNAEGVEDTPYEDKEW